MAAGTTSCQHDFFSSLLKEIVLCDAPDIAKLMALAQERAFWRKADLLARYRREAETARRRAFRTYSRALEADDPMPRHALMEDH